MIDAVVKWVDSAVPPPAADSTAPFMRTMTAGIGPRGDDSADNFHVVVCNAAWIAERLNRYLLWGIRGPGRFSGPGHSTGAEAPLGSVRFGS
jgi:hypothetical protein